MKEKYSKDLEEIKNIMNRSSRFISLSGLSGVSTGITALIGVIIAYYTIFEGNEYLVYNRIFLSGDKLLYLFLIAGGTLLVSIIAAMYFTRRETIKHDIGVWDVQSKQLLISLLIPLVAGGILCIILLFKGLVGLLPPMTLIFYGLALINGSKYTLPEIRNLGLAEILLGLLALQVIEFGLMFWAIGFGIIQIIYGLIIQRKYSS